MKTERAFTLVEIMIVLVIIGLLGTFLFGRLFGAGEDIKARMTQLKMKTLSQKIGEYKLRYNALPISLSDLTECSEVTGPGCIPLLKKDDDLFSDAWGGEFTYTTDRKKAYRIQSLGADGKPGGEGVDYDFAFDGP